ncbi:hypothetical protein FGO68_gene12633 [Halteria grandinella]|uniref:Uncharacterized protein n=1 Tax=Halteria grandinella TaxID=5974 RepID=A0A8J8P0C3_HALGN|nr:hypothetical protein FGO68_gene12633 [Halteria grandinella]
MPPFALFVMRFAYSSADLYLARISLEPSVVVVLLVLLRFCSQGHTFLFCPIVLFSPTINNSSSSSSFIIEAMFFNRCDDYTVLFLNALVQSSVLIDLQGLRYMSVAVYWSSGLSIMFLKSLAPSKVESKCKSSVRISSSRSGW